jgi:Transposase IS66 family
MVGERRAWAEQLAQVKRLRQWVLDAEHILDASWAKPGERVSNEQVGRRFDRWRKTVSRCLADSSLSPVEQECLGQFLQVLANQRPYLIQCDNCQEFPRTNNELERSIRGVKTQYRRISGRKNWNSYLLRYGRCVAYAAWWEQDRAHQQLFEQRVEHLDRNRWRELRQETKAAQGEHLTRFRFRHKRQQFLASLEARWETASPTHSLP